MESPKKKTRPSFEEVVNAFNDSKVISSSITLKDLAAVSSKLTSSLDDDELASWTFVGPNWVYKGDDFEAPEVVIRNQRSQ